MGIQSLLFAGSNSTIYDPNSDPDFPNVSLLLKMDGANGSTSFADSSLNNVALTPGGSAVMSTAQSKFGGSSFYTGASTEARLMATSGINFSFPGDFTIECWVYFTENDVGYQAIMGAYTTEDQTAWVLAIESNNTYAFYGTSGGGWGLAVNTGVVPTLNTWQHIAVSRFENYIYLYVDGVSSAGGYASTSIVSGTNLEIGNYAMLPIGRRAISGYLDEVRITKGIARYTANFTSPTAPFPTQGPDTYFPYVSLLLNGDAFTDLSSNASAVTVYGNASIVSSGGPFGGAAMAFDGNGDYLTIASSTLWNFGTGDWTVEVWIKLNEYGGTTGGAALFGTTYGATSGYTIQVGESANRFRLTSNASGAWADDLVPSSGPVLNAWEFMQITRNGNTISIAKNGTVVGTVVCAGYNFTNPSSVAAVGVLNDGQNIRFLNGLIGPLRVTKGIARAIAVPTAPFPTTQGTEIVSSGLTTYLDAGNAASYPGTGTTWTDLSGNGNNGTLVNGVGYSSANGGVLTTSGNSDRIEIPIDLRTTTHTIICIAKRVSVGGRVVSSISNNWLMGWYDEYVDAYFAEGWVNPQPNSVPQSSEWICYAAVEVPSSDQYSLYKNGVLLFGPSSNGNEGPNGIMLGGSGLYSQWANSQIGCLLVYSRALTDAEITQNLNALRERFGL